MEAVKRLSCGSSWMRWGSEPKSCRLSFRFASDIRYLLRYLRPRSGSLRGGHLSWGNTLLRYLIEDQDQVVLDASIAVSAPIDLAACARHISGGASRLYLGMFLRSLKAKLRARPSSTNKLVSMLRPHFGLRHLRSLIAWSPVCCMDLTMHRTTILSARPSLFCLENS